MCIKRDECAQGEGHDEVTFTSPVATLHLVSIRAPWVGLPTGTYFGPTEDIKLLSVQAGVCHSPAMGLVPLSFVRVVIEGHLKLGHPTYLLSHAGFREGRPRFAIRKLAASSMGEWDWWIIPKWMACWFRLEGTRGWFLKEPTFYNESFSLRKSA